MKLVTFKYENKIAVGAVKDERVFNLNQLDSNIPNDMIKFITNIDSNLKKAEEAMKIMRE